MRFVFNDYVPCTCDEAIKIIMSKSCNDFMHLDKEIPYCRRFGNSLLLRFNTLEVHPLRRWLKISVSEKSGNTKISGRFIYPITTSFIFILFCAILVKKNIDFLTTIELSLKNISNLLIVEVVFFLFYGFVIFMFISGKYLYLEKERKLIKWIQSLIQSLKNN